MSLADRVARVARGGRVGAAFAASVVLAACADVPTAAPTSPVGSTWTASAIAIASPSEAPIATAEPTVGPTPFPTPAAVAGDWRAVLGQAAVSDALFEDVVWTGHRFVAAGAIRTGGGVLVSSTDGKTWRSIPAGGTSGEPEHFAAGTGGVVATGTIDGHSAAWHSTDGRNWTYRTRVFPITLQGDDRVRVTDVVATSTGWLAVGRDEYCPLECVSDPIRALAWTSTDAQTWTRIGPQASFPRGGINAVTAMDSGYVAVGDSGGHAAIWTSPDGLAWTRIADDPTFGPTPGSPAGASVTATGVAAGFGAIVAVGMELGAAVEGRPVVVAWRSIDGHTWTPARVENAETGQVFSVAATARGFLATGPSGATSCLGGVWSSSDGASWACEASDPGFEGFSPYAAAGSPDVDVVVGLGSGPDEGGGFPGAIWWRPIP